MTSFKNWFERWGQDLWEIATFDLSSPQDVADDYSDIMQQVRKRYLKRQKKVRPETLDQELISVFLKEWLRRYRDPLQQKKRRERLLPLMVFKLSWPLEQVAKVMRISISLLRFQLLEGLRSVPELEFPDEKSLSRECYRSDLVVLDFILNREWPDPLHLFTKKSFERHTESCTRCSQQLASLRQGIALFKALEFVPLPEAVRNGLSEISSKSAPLPKPRFSLGPLYQKLGWHWRLGFQLALGALVVVLILRLPQMSSVVPWVNDRSSEFVLKVKEQSEKLKSTYATLTQESVEPPPPAPEGPQQFAPPVLAQLSERQTAQTPTPDTAVVKEKETSSNASSTPLVTAPEKPKVEKVSDRIFYSWEASSHDLSVDGSRVMEILSRYQATQGGDLALGANYRGGRYYHFLVNDERFNDLLEEIKILKLTQFRSTKGESSRTPIPGKRRVVFLLTGTN